MSPGPWSCRRRSRRLPRSRPWERLTSSQAHLSRQKGHIPGFAHTWASKGIQIIDRQPLNRCICMHYRFCVYIYTQKYYVYVYIYTHTHVYRHTYVCTLYRHTYVCMHVYMYIHIYTCIYIYIYIYLFIYLCLDLSRNPTSFHDALSLSFPLYGVLVLNASNTKPTAPPTSLDF